MPFLNEGPASDSESIFDNSEINGLDSSIYHRPQLMARLARVKKVPANVPAKDHRYI